MTYHVCGRASELAGTLYKHLKADPHFGTMLVEGYQRKTLKIKRIHVYGDREDASLCPLVALFCELVSTRGTTDTGGHVFSDLSDVRMPRPKHSAQYRPAALPSTSPIRLTCALAPTIAEEQWKQAKRWSNRVREAGSGEEPAARCTQGEGATHSPPRAHPPARLRGKTHSSPHCHNSPVGTASRQLKPHCQCSKHCCHD